MIQALATLLSLAGLALNVLRVRWCFVVWLGSNALWFAEGARRGMWGMMLVQAAFAAVGVVGFVRWGQDERRTKDEGGTEVRPKDQSSKCGSRVRARQRRRAAGNRSRKSESEKGRAKHRRMMIQLLRDSRGRG